MMAKAEDNESGSTGKLPTNIEIEEPSTAVKKPKLNVSKTVEIAASSTPSRLS